MLVNEARRKARTMKVGPKTLPSVATVERKERRLQHRLCGNNSRVVLRAARGARTLSEYLYVCIYVFKCSLCTVSVQWSVAQSACVLRALSVHDRVSSSDKGR